MPGRDDRLGDKKSRKPCLRNRRMGGMYKSIKSIVQLYYLRDALLRAVGSRAFSCPGFLAQASLLCVLRAMLLVIGSEYEFMSFCWFSQVLGGPARHGHFLEVAITRGDLLSVVVASSPVHVRLSQRRMPLRTVTGQALLLFVTASSRERA